jgi:hypothetical protein
MVTDSIPPSSASAMAARSTRSLVNGLRVSALGSDLVITFASMSLAT